MGRSDADRSLLWQFAGFLNLLKTMGVLPLHLRKEANDLLDKIGTALAEGD